MSRACDSCTMCCKTVGVLSFEKPADTWCEHCDIGQGCAIYGRHPSECQTYQCLWLTNPWMADDLRPDKTKIVMEGCWGMDRQLPLIIAMVDPSRPDAWKAKKVGQLFHQLNKAGQSIMISIGGKGEPTGDNVFFALAKGHTKDDVINMLRETRDANMTRHAEDTGISIDEAFAQAQRTMRKEATT